MHDRLAGLPILALCALGLALGPARAEVLEAGQGHRFATPSKAIAAAKDGDTVQIYPGEYFDCAIVKRDNLTIEGVGDGVVLRDNICQGKALLVINGQNVTIRNLTLERARDVEGNGAGIRGQGGSLTVDHVRFINDQDGILVATNPQAVIRVIDSVFKDNGTCSGRGCAHAIYVNHVAELDIEGSRFSDTHEGHNIKSRAAVTKVVNSVIEDGPDGSSSYLIDVPNGGKVLIEGNQMEKGPKSQNWANTIMIGEAGVSQPTPDIVVKDNVLTNNTGHDTTFVHNVTATPAQLSGNRFAGGKVNPLKGDGSSG